MNEKNIHLPTSVISPVVLFPQGSDEFAHMPGKYNHGYFSLIFANNLTIYINEGNDTKVSCGPYLSMGKGVTLT